MHRKVYSGVCGMAIVRRVKKAPYYRCDTPNSLPDAEYCRDKIYEQEILDAVTEAICMQAQIIVYNCKKAALGVNWTYSVIGYLILREDEKCLVGK